MIGFIQSALAELSLKFYIYQVIAIVLLMVYGLILVTLIRVKCLSLMDLIVSYPLSLLIYSISGYFLLSFGIPFNKYTQVGLMIFILASLVFAKKDKINEIKDAVGLNKKMIIIYLLIGTALALLLTSGIVNISVTNDSMYFFSEYPRALVNYGKLNSILDNFLTDASQGVAIIGTIPFLFGFDEIFGILLLMSVNFVIFFAYAVYDNISGFSDKKTAYKMSGLAVLMLLSAMPFVIMSRWLMANTFFMEYMVIVIYLAYKYAKKTTTADLIILSVFITGLSLMRMEGALNAGVIVLCIMMLEYKNKDVIFYMVCPMIILQGMYLFRIFKILTLHTGIQFMTKEKALILIAFLVCIVIYNALIRGKILLKVQKYYEWILVFGLVFVNVVVLLYDSGDYINNLKSLVLNVLLNSGWGLFAAVIIGVLIIIPKKSIRINYFDIAVVCYVLLTIVAGWARGDSLYVSFGDSGNRILIQVVPALIFAVIIKIAEGLEYWKKEELKTTE